MIFILFIFDWKIHVIQSNFFQSHDVKGILFLATFKKAETVWVILKFKQSEMEEF